MTLIHYADRATMSAACGADSYEAALHAANVTCPACLALITPADEIVSTSTLWVCVDCYETHHGVMERDPDPRAPEPLSLLSDSDDVAAGLTWEEHNDECPNHNAREWVAECECERIEFTWASCDGCGSHLGGAREALTLFHYDDGDK